MRQLLTFAFKVRLRYALKQHVAHRVPLRHNHSFPPKER